MMGFKNKGFEEAHLFALREQMKNLVLDEPLSSNHDTNNNNHWNNNNNSYSSYRSATSDTTHHPLSPLILVTLADSFTLPFTLSYLQHI
ncbi:hypothetical protein PTKIN_Ptkin03bG0005500 [Pterospermum kingtungense]